MMQKEYRRIRRLIIGAGETVEGVIPQRMPKRGRVGAYLVARTATDAAAREGQTHAVEL